MAGSKRSMSALFDAAYAAHPDDDDEAIRHFTDTVLGVGAYDKGFGVYPHPHSNGTRWTYVLASDARLSSARRDVLKRWSSKKAVWDSAEWQERMEA